MVLLLLLLLVRVLRLLLVVRLVLRLLVLRLLKLFVLCLRQSVLLLVVVLGRLLRLYCGASITTVGARRSTGKVRHDGTSLSRHGAP
jgi:hypothetical protein